MGTSGSECESRLVPGPLPLATPCLSGGLWWVGGGLVRFSMVFCGFLWFFYGFSMVFCGFSMVFCGFLWFFCGFLWFSMVFYGFVAPSSPPCRESLCIPDRGASWALTGPSAMSRGPAMDGLVSTWRTSCSFPKRGSEKVDLTGPHF